MAKTFRTTMCLQKYILTQLSTLNQNSVKIRAFIGTFPGAGVTLEIAYKVSARFNAPLDTLIRHNIVLHLLDIPSSDFTLEDDRLALLVQETKLFLSYCHSSEYRGLLPAGGI
ncbi:MAG: hypothetical protein K0U41_06525 [Gammaproteobacteria bacterium]|nr:hypothetical protein [Gammaproteobacteria bacterium]